jgi:DhnA family fructose-bisphosphate aldolase class Ia
MIPYDHGQFSGVQHGIEDPIRLTEMIARTPADGILVTPGVLKAIAPVVGNLGVMVRIDGGFTKFARHQIDYQAMYSVADAVKLGADSVVVFTFIDTDAEKESIRRLGVTAAEADAWGVPLAAEILAPSLLNNHFNTEIFARRIERQVVLEETVTVARIGVESGADIIKTRYTGSVEGFRQVVRTCGARVIVAGGPHGHGSDEQLLRMAADCVAAGAAGIIFGRNVWQHPKAEKLINALCAVVHEEESVEAALKLLR